MIEDDKVPHNPASLSSCLDAVSSLHADPAIQALVLETASEAVYVFDAHQRLIHVNAAACRQSGYSRDELLRMHAGDLDFGHSAATDFRAQPGERRVFEGIVRCKAGTRLPVEVSLVGASLHGAAINSAFVRDITARRALHEDEQRFRQIADMSPVGLVISERGSGRIVYANRQAERMLYAGADDLPDRTLHEVLAVITADGDLLELLEREVHLHNHEVSLRQGEHYSWISLTTSPLVLDGMPLQCMAMMDVTESFELLNQLSFHATYDELTGLVNRREFEDRLQEVIELANMNEAENSLCYLDLDQFKVINDTCGHMAGDELLRQLAKDLHQSMRSEDTLARFGGDEFAILMENCPLAQAERIAAELLQRVQGFRFAWQENVFTVGVSIGLTQIAQKGDSLTEVLRRADAACYAAKEAGRNRLHVFRLDDRQLAERDVEMRWVARIQAALDEDRFELWIQEIAEINREEAPAGCSATDHFEVLLRMRDTDGTLVTPSVFLPAAERYALATRIDRWVLHALTRWLKVDVRQRRRQGLCAINLSGQTLGDESFHREVIALLEDSDIPADRLCFEITETSAIANLSNATLFMHRLRRHGCSFALDDFGRGLSSFAYLKRLPVDYVKIDGLFVKDILSDPVDRAMVKAIIDMAHAMGKKTIAEFVENDAILQELIDLGVDYVQGYGISRPRRLL